MQQNLSNMSGIGLFKGQYHTTVSGVYHLLSNYAPQLAYRFLTRYSVIMNNVYKGYLDSQEAMNLFWLRELAPLPLANLSIVRSCLSMNCDISTYLDNFEKHIIPTVSQYLIWGDL